MPSSSPPHRLTPIGIPAWEDPLPAPPLVPTDVSPPAQDTGPPGADDHLVRSLGELHGKIDKLMASHVEVQKLMRRILDNEFAHNETHRRIAHQLAAQDKRIEALEFPGDKPTLNGNHG